MTMNEAVALINEHSVNFKLLPLTKGRVAIVDIDDFENLNEWKWSLDGKGYAIRNSAVTKGIRRAALMHRQIICASNGIQVDHRNHDRIDNRKFNLRLATHSQNMRNKSGGTGVSGIKGVTWDKQAGKWKAQMKVNGKYKNLGLFKNKEEAGEVYAEVAKEIHGEFFQL